MHEFKFRLSGENEPVSVSASHAGAAFSRLGRVKRLIGSTVISCWRGSENPQKGVDGRVSYNELVGMAVRKPIDKGSIAVNDEFGFVDELEPKSSYDQ